MQFQVAFQVAFLLTGWLSAGCSATYDQCVTQAEIRNVYRKVSLVESLELIDFEIETKTNSRDRVQKRLEALLAEIDGRSAAYAESCPSRIDLEKRFRAILWNRYIEIVDWLIDSLQQLRLRDVRALDAVNTLLEKSNIGSKAAAYKNYRIYRDVKILPLLEILIEKIDFE